MMSVVLRFRLAHGSSMVFVSSSMAKGPGLMIMGGCFAATSPLGLGDSGDFPHEQ